MFRPIDLARAVGVSTQTVRGYEKVGFLPQAERTSTGQRRYGSRHIQAIQTARTMIAGYGWQHALEIMRVAHQGNLAEVVAQVDTRHAEQAQQRQDIDTVLAVLQTLGQRETEPEETDALPTETTGLAGQRGSAAGGCTSFGAAVLGGTGAAPTRARSRQPLSTIFPRADAAVTDDRVAAQGGIRIHGDSQHRRRTQCGDVGAGIGSH